MYSILCKCKIARQLFFFSSLMQFAIAHDTCTRICLCVHVYRILLLQKRDLVQCEVYSPCIKYTSMSIANFILKLLLLGCLMFCYIFFRKNLYIRIMQKQTILYSSSVLWLFFFVLFFLQFIYRFSSYLFFSLQFHSKSITTTHR